MLDINWNPSRRDLRQFALIWMPLFAGVAGALLAYRSGAWQAAYAIWGVAALVATLGITKLSAVRPVFIGLMAVSAPIGWVVSHVVFALVFFGLFTLVGGIMRLVRYDPMRRYPDGAAPSYWIAKHPRTDVSTYFRQS